MQTGAGHLYHDLINVSSLAHDILVEAPKNDVLRLRQFTELSIHLFGQFGKYLMFL